MHDNDPHHLPHRHVDSDNPPSGPSPLQIFLTRPALPLLPAPPHTYPPPTPVNPSQLPDEVLLSIFDNLSHARDIAAVRGVCNSWRTLVDDAHSIWRRLVFDLPRCPSTAKYAETWYRKAADYGNAQAQFLLALLYTYGYGNHSRQRAYRHAP